MSTPPLEPRLVADPAPSGSEGAAGASEPPLYDLSYRDVFWRSRSYEDRCDRTALRALLPRGGDALVEVGAGFGRLVDEYRSFASVTLVDTSAELLEAARERTAADPRVAVVQADAARIPLPDASVDVVVAVRLILHLEDPEPMFREVRRILRPGGTFIVEFANQRHLLRVLRSVARREPSAGPGPLQYLPGHWAHRRSTIEGQLREAGLRPNATRAVSLFRARALKRMIPARVLAGIEAPLQYPLGPLGLSPSIYLRSRRPAGPAREGS